MKIIEKQRNSKNCFICGLDSSCGVRAPFYSMEDGSCATIFKFKFEHQSYPGRVHGGIISALLDEVMGRAIWTSEPTTFGVTTTMSITYRKPVNYDTPLKARGYITFKSALGFSAKGEIYDMQGTLLAQGEAKYLKLPANKVTEGVDADDEMCYLVKDNLTEIDFPKI